MGFLQESVPLAWEDSLDLLRYVRVHGLEQFLHIFHSVRHVEGDLLRWGDEIEYALVELVGNKDDPNRGVRIALRSPEVIKELKKLEQHGIAHGLSEADRCNWMPEYGRWMLEGTPGKPFEGVTSLVRVEDSMILRRSRLMSVLKDHEVLATMACFPMLGVGLCTSPPAAPGGEVTESLFVPDSCIFPHARFRTLTANIRKRRGGKVCILRPKFQDVNTAPPSATASIPPSSVEEADSLQDVYADAMAFGMGSCCLQVTLQAKSLSESRHLYDHLAVLTPVMMALTAATPILRGWLLDEDCRWEIVGDSVDDRREAERGDDPLGKQQGEPRLAGQGVRYLPKSRYSGIDCYLCNCKGGTNAQSRVQRYNDARMSMDPEHEERLVAGGVDRVLAAHVAHLFARDPLVIFKDKVELDDRLHPDHWENLQSTNWQSVRWKPPHPAKGIKDKDSEDHVGWRVEFRTMELQLTDFENAAFVVFIVLLSRVILGLDLNLYIPISKLDENMKRAHARDAYKTERFWFRKNMMPSDVADDLAAKGCCKEGRDSGTTRDGMGQTSSKESSVSGFSTKKNGKQAPHDECELMSAEEIMCGKPGEFPGLIPLCKTYLNFIGCDSVTMQKLEGYLSFIEARARGKLMTPAAWIRKFVLSHPDYKRDSRVPHSTGYDLLMACKEIGEGTRHVPELYGKRHLPHVKAASNPFHPESSRRGLAGEPECGEVLLAAYLNRAVAKEREQAEEQIMQKEEEARRVNAELEELRSTLADVLG